MHKLCSLSLPGLNGAGGKTSLDMKTSQKIWILLGLIALVLRWLANSCPACVEQWYSRGVFAAIRVVIDYGLAWMPFPLVYLLLLWVGWRLVRQTRRFFSKHLPWRTRWLKACWSLLAFTGGVVFWFLLLWGFNYGRIPLEEQLGLTLQPLSIADVEDELALTTQAMIQARQRIPRASDTALNEAALPARLEDDLRHLVARWLADEGYTTPGSVRGRLLYPKGVLLRFSTAGVYVPFTGEGHADAGLHPLQLPPVIAHELAHGMGFGDEGVCNFIAYQAGIRSDNPIIVYASLLSYWRTPAAHYRRLAPDQYKAMRERLPAGIRADLDAINQAMRRYPDILPRLRDAAYHTYLKAQGVDEGLLSYDKVMMLVRAARQK